MQLYPRTVAIHRPNGLTSGDVGAIGYQGVTQAAETVIATGLKCSIQAVGMGRVEARGITKSDSPGPAQWAIYFPLSAPAKGVIKDRDILIDDEGYRYQCAAAYWAPLGYRCDCIRLEA